MVNKLVLVLAVILCFPAFPADAGNVQTVKTVVVEGNRKISQEEILAKISVRPGLPYSVAEVRTAVRDLFSTGDFSDVTARTASVEGGIQVEFIVTENPVVDSLNFKGNQKYEAKDFEEKTGLKKGKSFTRKLLQDDVKVITDYYADEGFSLTKVKARYEEDEKNNTVAITFDIVEGKKMEVEKITITGVSVFSESKIKGKMETDESSFWKSGKYKEEVFQEDLERIIDFYRREGFAKAKIISRKVDVDEKTGKIKIEIELEEGRKYQFGHISVKVDDTSIHTDEEILDRILVKEGDVFSQERLDSEVNGVKVFYGEKGFINAWAFPAVNLKDDTGEAEVVIEVHEGQVAYVEDVQVEGNTRTKTHVIRREVLFEPGDQFDSQKLIRSLQKLNNLGFFDEVNYDLEPGSKDDSRILTIRVRDRMTGMISLGAGYSNLEKLTGSLQVTENNLFGNGQRVGVMWEFGKYKQNYEITFFEPWLFGTHTSFGTSIYDVIRGYFIGYTDERRGGYIRFGRTLTDFLKVWMTYRYEWIHIYNIKPDAPREIRDEAGYDEYAIDSYHKNTSSITTEVEHDTRDSIFFDTTKGHYYKFSVQYTGGILQGSYNFTKYILDVSWFLPFWWKFVLAFHTGVGYASGFSATPDVPQIEKFYMGGTDTVRGYDERALGPMEITPGENPTPGGGRFMNYGNLELRIPIYRPYLMSVIFADAGSVWDKPTQADYRDYGLGIGLGFRLTLSGAMMLRFDYGWPMTFPNEYLVAKSGRFHFNIGNIF